MVTYLHGLTFLGDRAWWHGFGWPWRGTSPTGASCGSLVPREAAVIFKAVGEGRPYPEHGLGTRQWVEIPPSQVRLDALVTTKKVLDLEVLLDDDSTFYGDLFAHVVEWHGELYLEDGVHRALRCALHARNVLHARVLRLPD